MRKLVKRLHHTLLIVSCLLWASLAVADPARSAKNTVYAEGLGPAGFYSLNYERSFGNWSARAGASLLVVTTAADELAGEVPGTAPIISVPLSATYLGWGRGSHIFEAGAGFTVAYLGARATHTFTDSALAASSSATTAWFFAPLGYRFQPPGVGFLFRAGLTPVISGAGFFPWPHIALGASF